MVVRKRNVKLIDGNMDNVRPCGYCDNPKHKGYLNDSLFREHMCAHKKCAYFILEQTRNEDVNRDYAKKLKKYHNVIKDLAERDFLKQNEYDLLKTVKSALFAQEYLDRLKKGQMVTNYDFSSRLIIARKPKEKKPKKNDQYDSKLISYTDIAGATYPFAPQGYCKFSGHRGYLNMKQYIQHRCQYKHCRHYIESYGQVELIDINKDKILKEFNNLICKLYFEDNKMATSRFLELKNNIDETYAFNYIRKYYYALADSKECTDDRNLVSKIFDYWMSKLLKIVYKNKRYTK